MECCSPLWGGSPCLPSYSAWCHGNQVLQGHWNPLRWSWVEGLITLSSQTGQWSLSSTTSFLVLYPLLFPCFVHQGFCRAHTIHHQHLSGETTKIQDHCSPPLSCSSFFPLVEPTSTSSISFFPQVFKTVTNPKPLSCLPSLTHPKSLLSIYRFSLLGVSFSMHAYFASCFCLFCPDPSSVLTLPRASTMYKTSSNELRSSSS